MCLQFVAWQPKYERPISRSTSSQGDQKLARVGRSAIDYKTVGKWHSTIHLMRLPTV